MIILAGATATGKTTLSLALAERIDGLEIVSADSRQVYRGMDIGTAKVSATERAAVPHHGLDLVDPDVGFTAADYRLAALDALEGIARRGGVACLVGGTGLYLRAIGRGLPLEELGIDPAVRAELERRLSTDGLDSLATELRGADPDGAATVDLRNPRRVVRALERLHVRGTASPPQPTGYPAPVAWLGLERPADAHRAAIADRVEWQFDAGLLEEAARLRLRYREDLPAFSAMGYREAFDVLAGRSDLPAAMDLDSRRTWAYARRQRTWLRSEPDLKSVAAGAGAIDRAWTALAPFIGALDGSEYAGRT